MKFRSFIFLTAISLFVVQLCLAQVETPPRILPPAPRESPTPKMSEILAINLAAVQKGQELPRERREQAYSRLMEGQRYILNANRLRSQAGIANALKLARQSLQKAVELNPNMAEGYTALAELAITTPPGDIDEAISLAAIATRLESNNFGGHRILARLYTYKSRLNTGALDSAFTQKAIFEWKEITRLDNRNAEGWAFLAEFYDKTNENELKISALRKWLASAAPIETQFYRRVMGAQEDLSPESASLKLGPALVKAGKTREAVEVLSVLVVDDPDNAEAVEHLRNAIESVDGPGAAAAIESLQQAVYSNPENLSLINLLAQAHMKAGKFDDAVKVLQDATVKFTEKDKRSAAILQISLGDMYVKAKRVNEGIAAYQNALTVRGITSTELATDDDREFATLVFTKMIRTYKDANRPNDVKAVIERARLLLGKEDLFADRELISFYRENGKKPEALQAVISVRERIPDDYGFLRLHATLLTESGKVDEAVGLIKNLIDNKPFKTTTASIPTAPNGTEVPSIEALSPMYDDFGNYLFISSLYTNANRGKEAAVAATAAYSVAKSPEQKEMAKLTLATAQQMGGEFAAAEATLREILKQTPGNPIALNNLGYFLLERNERFTEALDLIQKAIAIEPDNPSYLDSLGWAYFKLGKYAEAEKHLLEAARLSDDSSTIHEHIGDVYKKQNKLPAAKASWEKALTLATAAEDIGRLKTKLGRK
jgi:tetratricopeptide (TPR) repeat protein